MVIEKAPEKVQKANNARREYSKMVRMERKLQKRILEDPGPRPAIPEPSLHPVLPGRHSMERCGECDPCKAQDWRKGQLAPGCETEGQKPQKYVRRSREDVRTGRSPRHHRLPRGGLPA